MKAVFLLLIIPLLQVSARTYAQRITLQEKNASIELVFKKIKKQSGYSFLYEDGVLNEAKKVNLSISNESLETTLDRLFAEQPLTFSIKGKTIVVQPKEKSVVDKIIDFFSAIDVRGKVVDEKGEPLPGATVKVKGSTLGVMTDKDGEFFLKGVSEDAILTIAYLGYKPLELRASASMGVIKMELATSELEEVTVSTGYWETSKRLSTGNISKVTAKDIEKQPVTNPLMALQGRVAGLEITPSSGAPGVAPKILIRGVNSLRQNKVYGTAGIENDGNYPLYVIDGVPISSVPFNTTSLSYTAAGYDPLSTLNPATIESIEVLKDGDGTAIYGSRGANGVILITTKRSKPGERTNIDASVYTGVGQVSKQMNLLNREQYLSMRREGLSNSGITPEQANAFDLYLWDTTRSTNWQKELIGGNANITDLQAGISSGAKNTSFAFNLGYHKETMIFPGDFGYNRLSGQFSVNHISTDKKLRMFISTSYGLDNSHFFAGDLMTAALTLAPNAPKLYNQDGSLNWELHDLPGQRERYTWINPLSYLKVTQDANTRNNISNVSLVYEFLPGLSFSTTTGYTDVSNQEIKKNPKSSQPNSVNVFANFNNIRRTSWIIEPKVSYTKQISKHKLDFLIGSTWQRNTNFMHVARGQEYTSDALLGSLEGAGKVSIIRDELNEYKYNSVYARLGYNWREKYVLNLSGRRDGSSRFGPGSRFGNFGSIGAAWIFSDDKFIQRALSFISFGKLRASYGITGSDNIGDYNYYNLYKIAQTKYGSLSGIIPYALYNPNYAWEMTKKLETALELSFAQNKIGLEISWYRNRSSNQLIDYPLSDVTGFQSVLSNFEATVQNTGWEAILRGELLNVGPWRWNASINVSLPFNKLIRFDGIENSYYAKHYKVGEPLSISTVLTWLGVNEETGLHEFVDENNDGKLTDPDDFTLHNLTGTVYYGGVNNTLQFMNVEISFLFQFSHRQSTRYLPETPGAAINQPVYVLRRWQKRGDETDVQKFSNHLNPNNTIADAHTQFGFLSRSDYNSIDATFLRLKTFSVGYRLPNSWSKKARIQQSSIFLQGQNLLTLTKYKGLDPETGSGLPPLRMITAGVQFKF